MKLTTGLLRVLLLTVAGTLAGAEMRGLLVFGHEVRSLQLCGGTQVFWIHAPDQLRQQLQADYRRLVKQPYEPLYVELEGAFREQPVTSRASAYAEALLRAASFATDANRLSLQDAAEREVAVFETRSLRLAGTSWEVIAYNNGKQAVVSVLGGTRITAHFGDDGRVTGSAGCNHYFASYEVKGELISIALPGATHRHCAEPQRAMDQEARFLEALRSAATFRLEGERLALRTPGGALAVNLVRDSSAAPGSVSASKSKIRFDLDRLDADGLQGPPDGLRALHYEYCIPDRPEAIRAVTAIDPTLQIQRGSPGRVGCGAVELLCLGHTHQPGHRAVLGRLAALPFVAEICEAFFE